MALSLGFLRTRVGRRYLAVHLLTALAPLAVTGVLAYRFVREQVREEAEGRVSRLSKQLTLSTLASLSLVAHDATRGEATDSLPVAGAGAAQAGSAPGAPGGKEAALARIARERLLSDDERLHLEDGRPLLVVIPGEEDATILFVTLEATRGQGTPALQWQRANRALLWSGSDENIAADDAAYCLVQAHTGARVHCAPGMSPAMVQLAIDNAGTGLETRRASEIDGLFVSSRDVYLQHEFGATAWRAVVLQPAAVAYEPLAAFRRVMVLGLLAVAILIFAVSHVQLRRTTEPLGEIHRATTRVQDGDFSQPVPVLTDDEYGDVAQSFNAMTGTLNRQLQLLGNLDAIDRSALGARETHAVALEALGRVWTSVRCSHAVIGVCAPDDAAVLELTAMTPLTLVPRTIRAPLSPDDRARLVASPRIVTRPGGDATPKYLESTLGGPGKGDVVTLPLLDDDRLLGCIALRCSAQVDPEGVDVQEARRLADRVALALSHVRLVRRLDALSAGTLIAFARAIDANSPWTAGHSERVTRTAIVAGRRLRLSTAELEILERGGLLHDIGKIAVPPSVLDKPGRLTPDEWNLMRRHPEVGCDILAPIPAFADAMPIVRSHHERFDGSGYPDGLRGTEIPFLARVLAAADVFDALVSDRPYRAGMSLADATTVLREGSGTHFDPEVAAAFLEAVRAGEIRADRGDGAASTLAAEVASARQRLLVTA